jgi:hypothetical protein
VAGLISVWTWPNERGQDDSMHGHIAPNAIVLQGHTEVSTSNHTRSQIAKMASVVREDDSCFGYEVFWPARNCGEVIDRWNGY